MVGRPDDLKGQAIAAFVTLEGRRKATDELREELRGHVAKEIGAFARPDDLRFTDSLPKTRSGKIMRRLLRQIAAGTIPWATRPRSKTSRCWPACAKTRSRSAILKDQAVVIAPRLPMAL